MITDYDFFKTDSPEAKQFISFLGEIDFDLLRKDKSSRDKKLIQNYYNKRVLPACGLKTNFFSENPNEVCDRTKLLLQEKRAGNKTNIINEEIFALVDEILENKCITSTQRTKIY